MACVALPVYWSLAGYGAQCQQALTPFRLSDYLSAPMVMPRTK